jgi:hypothetical protein
MIISVPTSIQDIVPGKSIWDRQVFLLSVTWITWKLAYAQMVFFVIGVAAFAVGAIGRLYLPVPPI